MEAVKSFDDIKFDSDDVTDAEYKVINTDDHTLDDKEDIAPGYIKCEVCGDFLKFMTASHLVKHGWTMDRYKEEFPNAPFKAAPPEPYKPLEEITYIDVDGKIRYKDTHKLVDEIEILEKFDISKYEEMEMDFKFLAMAKSKKVLQWLDDIVHYDQKKAKDKSAKFTPALQVKAAELILNYGPPKAAQRKETHTTVKKLNVTIAGTLPKQLRAEDF